MILIDLSQTLIGGIMAQIGPKKNIPLSEDLIRHMCVNTIRSHVVKFKKEYGEVVLCCDNKEYWRKEFFQFYKSGRKKARTKSGLDWPTFFVILNKLTEEFKENLPYKMMNVQRAEADDIIGTLVPRFAPHEPIMIVSADGDFLQLQRHLNVKQYSPTLKKFIKSINPEMDLFVKILTGESAQGDGIPNVLSDGNSFADSIQQKSLTKKWIKHLSEINKEYWPEHIRINWSRNETLIDLRHIPPDIAQNIINTYDNTEPAPRKNLLGYLIDKQLVNLIDVVEDF